MMITAVNAPVGIEVYARDTLGLAKGTHSTRKVIRGMKFDAHDWFRERVGSCK